MKGKFNILLAAILLSANISLAAGNFSYTEQTPVYQQQQYNQPQYNNPAPQFGAQANNYQRQNYNSNAQTVNTNQTLKGHIVTVPAGQNIPVITTMALSSANLTLGQNVTVALGSDFYYNGSLIAPAGSVVCSPIFFFSPGLS